MATAPQPQTVVITGASAGIGRATARAFAAEKARIGLISRNRERLEQARREVEERGGQAIVLPLDVADAEALEHAADAVESAFGPIDVWVNNAMVSVFSPVKDMTAAEYRRVTEVTYLGYVHGTLAALRRMLPRDRGVVVQVGSALTHRSIPLQSAYCAAKHAIEGFCESLWSELIHDRSQVKLTIVQMPALNTPQFDWVKSRLPRKPQPVPPIFQPEVAARAILHAAHHPRREYWVGWPTVKAMIGEKLIPGLIDRYLGRTGYETQQYDGPADPQRPDNLWQTVDGPFGAHGDFDQRAHPVSWQFEVARHRRQLALAGLALAGAGWLAAQWHRQSA